MPTSCPGTGLPSEVTVFCLQLKQEGYLRLGHQATDMESLLPTSLDMARHCHNGIAMRHCTSAIQKMCVMAVAIGDEDGMGTGKTSFPG